MWEVQLIATNRKGDRKTARWRFRERCDRTLAGQLNQVHPGYRLVRCQWRQVVGCAV